MPSEQVVEYTQVVNSTSGEGLVGTPSAALRLRTPGNFFVEPTFIATHTSDSPTVTLISARGAAGKSATANALSERLNAPVWRLEDDKAVGYSSVHSTLSRYLDTVEISKKLPTVQPSLIIIDSVDEARSRVTASSWEEFVEALTEVNRYGLQLVIMGRTQTITDLWVKLEDNNISTNWYEISHFDVTSSEDYVNARSTTIDQGLDPTNEAYIAARAAVLAALRNQVSELDSERFVGYPPVLDAVAALLAHANLQGVRNDFETQSFDRRIQVLERILIELLEREKRKVAPLLKDLGLADIEGCYSIREQFEWLLHDLEGAAQPELGNIDNAQICSDYRKKIVSFVKDHPFRNYDDWSSPVFQSYVVWSMFDESEDSLVLNTGKTSGMLFEFAAGLHGDELMVTEAQFAALHSSLLSGRRHDVDVAAAIRSAEDHYLPV